MDEQLSSERGTMEGDSDMLTVDLQEEAHRPRNPPLWGWRTYASLAISVGILYSLWIRIDMRQVWHQVASANKTFIVLAVMAHYVTYILRGARWRHGLMHLSPCTSVSKFSLLVFFCNAIDNIVPAKLSDIYAAHLAHINVDIERATALGSLLFLRMLDAWVVLMLATLASWRLFAFDLPLVVLWSLRLGALLAMGATGILLIGVLCRWTLLTRLPIRISHMLRAFHVGAWPHRHQIVPIAGLTITIWTLETLAMAGFAFAFGLHASPDQAIFLTTMPLLASAFPLTPAGVGVVELTLFSCLHLLSVSTTTAMSVTVVNRLLDYWLHLVLGAVIWMLRRFVGLNTWREASRPSCRPCMRRWLSGVKWANTSAYGPFVGVEVPQKTDCDHTKCCASEKRG